jgi:hypothetical protein
MHQVSKILFCHETLHVYGYLYEDVFICLYTTRQHGVEGKTVGRIEVTEDEEEGISSYWKTLRKREGAGN